MSRIGKQPIEIPGGVEVTVGHGQPRHREGPARHPHADDASRHADRSARTARSAWSAPTTRACTAACTGSRARWSPTWSPASRTGSRSSCRSWASATAPRSRARTSRSRRATRTRSLVPVPEGIEFEVPTPTQIVVRGNDKQAVGEIAAKIRKIRKPEPYKGKGIRYEGEYVRKKAGKAAKGAGA